MSCIVIEIEHFRDGSSVPRAVRSLIVPEPGGHSWPQGWNTVVAKDPHQRQGRSQPLPLNGAAIQKGIWRTSNHASHKGGDRAASSRKRNKFPQGRLKVVNPRDSIRQRTRENRKQWTMEIEENNDQWNLRKWLLKITTTTTTTGEYKIRKNNTTDNTIFTNI